MSDEHLHHCTILLLCLFFSVKSVVSWAHDEKSGEKINHFSGSVVGSGNFSMGNSDTQSGSAKVNLLYEHKKWENKASLEGLIGYSHNKAVSESLVFDNNLRYQWQPDASFAFTKFEFLYDKFASYDVIFREALGLGTVVYKSDTTKVDIEAGPGGSHSRIAGINRYDHQFVGYIGTNFKKKFNDQLEWNKSINVHIGAKNTNFRIIDSLKICLSKKLALELSYTIEYITKIPAGSKNSKKMDTVGRVALIYNF